VNSEFFFCCPINAKLLPKRRELGRVIEEDLEFGCESRGRIAAAFAAEDFTKAFRKESGGFEGFHERY
jgi:hypothetical protein